MDMKVKENLNDSNDSLRQRLQEVLLLDSNTAKKWDSKFRARLAKTTGGMSPALVTTATVDWLSHLALSPAKQLALAGSSISKLGKLGRYAVSSAMDSDAAKPAIPERGDLRFDDESWRRWPFNVMAQAFLLARELGIEATTDIPGQDPSHEAFVEFLLTQVLDSLSPSNYPLTNPQVIGATRAERGANLRRGLGNLVRDLRRQLKSEPKPGNEDFKVGEQLAITPGKVVFQNELIELIQYSPVTDTVEAEPVLIVPPWIMKYYILDLSPKNSMTKFLVEQGRTVFMISWKNPKEEYRDYGLEDYVNKGIMAALKAINAIVPKQKVNAVGYCAGGSLTAIAAAMMARDDDDRLSSLTTFTAQTDFTEPGQIKIYLNESTLAYMKDMMEADGYLDKVYFTRTFGSLNANNLIWGPAVKRYFLGQDDSLFDLMAWNADLTRVPARLQYESMKSMFVRNELAEGTYEINGGKIHLSDLRIPLFFVGTTTDHVAPWKSVYKIHGLAPNTETTFCLTSGGHNTGIVTGPENPKRSHQIATRQVGESILHADEWEETTPTIEGTWWNSWTEWMAQRSSGHIAAPKMGAARKGYKILCDAPGTYVHEQ